ncbi:MAG: hypothetical protein HY672_00825 [Chloroflexi bacterium]|nr:hypothetical protein [Chloroflexota bacterium]
MRKGHLPADSKRYAEQAFREKERWHRRQERMSLTLKIVVLDRLWEMAKELPKLENEVEVRNRAGGQERLLPL